MRRTRSGIGPSQMLPALAARSHEASVLAYAYLRLSPLRSRNRRTESGTVRCSRCLRPERSISSGSVQSALSGASSSMVGTRTHRRCCARVACCFGSSPRTTIPRTCSSSHLGMTRTGTLRTGAEAFSGRRRPRRWHRRATKVTPGSAVPRAGFSIGSIPSSGRHSRTSRG
jgi:hypothetical protein